MAMFYGSGLQMQQPNNSEVCLPDVELQPFTNMLKYLYTDELCIEADTVMTTLYVAKKYSVAALENECISFLKANLKPDNAFMLLQQAKLFDEIQLAKLCLEAIDKFANEAFTSEAFLEADRQTLEDVLKRDTLAIKELKLFECVVKWSVAQCEKALVDVGVENQKKLVGNLMDFVRFPLMSKEEFAVLMSEPGVRGLLDSEEIIEIFIYLTMKGSGGCGSGGEGPVNGVRKLRYCDRQRCFMGAIEQAICRFGHVESRWGYSGTSDRVKFSVNRRIYGN